MRPETREKIETAIITALLIGFIAVVLNSDQAITYFK